MHRPILAADRSHLAIARATEDAHPDDVIQDIANLVHSADTLSYEPRDALLWVHVENVIMAPLPDLRCHLPLDLRYGRWEPYERERLIPVLAAGVLVNTAILPQSATPEITQRRLHGTANAYEWRRLRITNGDSRIVETFMYPSQLIDDMQDLEEYRQNDDDRYEHAENSIWREPDEVALRGRDLRLTRSSRCTYGPWTRPLKPCPMPRELP